MPSARFYPDFMALLDDGRILAVEYKGKAWAELQKEQDKNTIGESWAEASDKKCLFVMPVASDFEAIGRTIEGG